MSAIAHAPPRRKPFDWLVSLAWFGVITAALQLALALLWQDELQDAGRGMLTLHCAAFMAQTFMFHAGLGGAIAVLIAAWFRRRRLLVCSAVVFLIGAVPELWMYLPSRRSEAIASPTLKVMSVNLMYGLGDHTRLLEQIERAKSDVLVFQEWTLDANNTLLPKLRDAFPHFSHEARDDAFGQAVFARRAFVVPVRAYPPVSGFTEPQMTLQVMFDGQPLTITNVHVLPPLGLSYFAHQRASVRLLASWCGDQSRPDRPDLLIGDFNAVPRSSIMRAMRNAGFRDAHVEAGWGRGVTWPRTGMLRLTPGIRLDHALTGERVISVQSEVGESYGSDHLPIMSTIAWASTADKSR